MILLSTWPRRIYRLTLLPPLLLPFPASGPREASVRTTNKFLLQKDTGSFSYDCSPLMNFVWLTVSSARDSKPLGCMSQRRHRRRSEEHTSELQSRFDLVCRLLLEKKKTKSS